MVDFNSEEDLGRLFKSLYRPVLPSPVFRKRLIEQLKFQLMELNRPSPILRWSKIWVPLCFILALALTGYGIWLSLNIALEVLP